MAGRTTEQSIRVPGLAKLQRDLKKIDKDLGKGLTDHLRQVARKVRDDARAKAPVDTGALRRSIKHSVRARGASVYSKSEYAAVHEWGGHIEPNGVPIDIEGKRMIYDAVGENTDHVYTELTRMLDAIADRNGFS